MNSRHIKITVLDRLDRRSILSCTVFGRFDYNTLHHVEQNGLGRLDLLDSIRYHMIGLVSFLLLFLVLPGHLFLLTH